MQAIRHRDDYRSGNAVFDPPDCWRVLVSRTRVVGIDIDAIISVSLRRFRLLIGRSTIRRHFSFAGILAFILTCTYANAAINESGFVEIGGLDQWIQIR